MIGSKHAICLISFLKASNEFSWQVVKLVFLGCNIPVDKYMWAGQFHFLSATLGSLTVDSPCRLSILIITFPFHSLRSRFCVNIFQVLKEPPDLLPYSPVRTFVGSLSRLRKPPKKSNFRTGYQILKYFEIYLFFNYESSNILDAELQYNLQDGE